MINKEKQREFYNDFVNRQLKSGIYSRHRHILKKLLQLNLCNAKNVFEIGCGIGTVSGLILKHLRKGTLLAIDLSPDSIEVAKQRLSKFQNVEFVAADVMEFEIQQQFDMIVLPDVLEHIPMEQHHELFVKLKQLLNPGGKIVIHIPNPYHLDCCRAQGMEMQIIDQALYLPLLVDNLKETGLFVSYLEVYSIWVKEGDYQFITLEHEEKFATSTPVIRNVPLLKKLREKISYEYRRRFGKAM
jgi:2-polyprenyl-3-methyl-5-hydroxy-6-metoxy-1,4-benzoquinol methylase